MENEVLRQLSARKSVRIYEDRPIPEEAREQILEAAFQAPTAGNMMLYSILEITDQALKDRLAETCDNQSFIAKAPWVLVFLADYRRWLEAFRMAGADPRQPGEGDWMLAVSDAVIAAQNAVTAAESLGVGSCYIGDILEQWETHRELLSLPAHVVPAAMLCFGYPTRQQQDRVKPRRFGSRHLVFENRYDVPQEADLREMFREQSGKEGAALEEYLRAFCQRKYNSGFSREMSRSVRAMLEAWTGE